MLASLLFVVGNLGVSGSTVFYDSLLPHVARPEETDRVSSAGYALGYLGGGLLLLINLAWILSRRRSASPTPSRPRRRRSSASPCGGWSSRSR